jgi:hypothetical protein
MELQALMALLEQQTQLQVLVLAAVVVGLLLLLGGLPMQEVQAVLLVAAEVAVVLKTLVLAIHLKSLVQGALAVLVV